MWFHFLQRWWCLWRIILSKLISLKLWCGRHIPYTRFHGQTVFRGVSPLWWSVDYSYNWEYLSREWIRRCHGTMYEGLPGSSCCLSSTSWPLCMGSYLAEGQDYVRIITFVKGAKNCCCVFVCCHPPRWLHINHLWTESRISRYSITFGDLRCTLAWFMQWHCWV